MTKLAVLLTALIVAGAIAAAYQIGFRAGYWRRVQEEKCARGIR